MFILFTHLIPGLGNDERQRYMYRNIYDSTILKNLMFNDYIYV